MPSNTPRWRSFVYALLPLALVLGATELVLHALGAGVRHRNVGRGFSRAATYVIADPDGSGGFHTQMFEGERKELAIPPKGERLRVVLFGGSNVEGWPEEGLQRLLNEQRPANRPEVEVINLGRHGYGSARIAILFEQALALQPDVCLFYEGHNEFIEKGFADEIDELSSGPTRVAIEMASHLRCYNALVDALKAAEPPGSAVTPEKWRWDYDRFKDYTRDQTLAHLEGFRENTEAMCALAAAHGARMVLSTAIYNMLAAPCTSNPPRDATPETRAEIERLLRAGEALLPEHLRPINSDRWLYCLRVQDWEQLATPLPAGWRQPVLRPVEVAGRANVVLWSDAQNWSPRLRLAMPAMELFLARQMSAEQRQDVEAARGTYRRLLELCPTHALACFELALCEYLLGNVDEARRLFTDAARFDCAPRKASEVTNDMLRSIAAEHPEVALIDIEPEFRARCPEGIVGFEHMMDDCHLHNRARWLLMDQLAPHLTEILWR